MVHYCDNIRGKGSENEHEMQGRTEMVKTSDMKTKGRELWGLTKGEDMSRNAGVETT